MRALARLDRNADALVRKRDGNADALVRKRRLRRHGREPTIARCTGAFFFRLLSFLSDR
jgi:hypothetical protein